MRFQVDAMDLKASRKIGCPMRSHGYKAKDRSVL